MGAKGFLLFVSGVAIGAALSIRFMQVKQEKEFQEAVDARIDDIMAEKKAVEQKEKKEKEEIKKRVNGEKVQYNHIVKEIKGETSDDDSEAVAAEYEHPEDSMEKAEYPYQISDDEWEERNGYEKESVYFYEGNHVLVNDHDEVVDTDDAETMLGHDYVNLLSGYGVIYIRNEKLETDYELVWNSASYPV